MKAINIHEAKTHLSRILRRVQKGEEAVISRSGKPVARIVPLEAPLTGPLLGADCGKFIVPKDFDAPLPNDILDAFE